VRGLAKGQFSGLVAADETDVDGLEKNQHANRKLHAGRGGTGKAIVVGMKERETNQVNAKVFKNTKRITLHGFIQDNVEEGSEVLTDDFRRHEKRVGFKHPSVQHPVGEYVKEQAHIHGIESCWAVLRRVHKGIYHKMSEKHLHRYVKEFSGQAQRSSA